MADSTELPHGHPMRVAFREYQNTDEYENNRKWAQFSQNVDGSLWSVFIAGMSAQSKLNAATPPADAAMADALEAASNRCHVQDVAALRKASAALRARPQAVAEGFVLVPAEPTEAMLSVAVDNWSGYEEESGRFYTPLDSDIRILWNVMLAASQSADVKAGG